jgi:acyl-CoA synthetase (AMP-forming)/AMP-acid ligase II
MNAAEPAPESDLVWNAWEHWARLAPDREAVVHWDAMGEPFRWRYGDLLQASLAIAGRLLEAGVDTGDVCATILRHHKDFYPTYLGICAIGALPAVLAYPNERLHPDKFAQGLKGMAQRSGLDWILTENELSAAVDQLVRAPGSSIRGILHPFDWKSDEAPGAAEAARAKRARLRPADPFLLQHSSGTTGLQKPVVLSHRAVLGHMARYAAAIALSPQDRVVSWLPLYHDMGLIAAFHLPLACGIPSIQISPFQWVAAPALFLEALVREKGTLSWLPNFAYNILASRVSPEEAADLDLSRVRLLINCSEAIRAESHDLFLKRFAASGLRREALSGCYAMAETVFAVTQTAPGHEAARLAADRKALRIGRWQAPKGQEAARICVSSGAPIRDCELKIIGEGGTTLPCDHVGEVAIRSASLFDGYRNYPEKTAEVLKNDWYYSGDLGFLHEEELYVVGRMKDTIIVAGKNLYPEDIEDAVGGVAGIIPGRVVAFGVESVADGTEQVCVVAETSAAEVEELKRLALAVKRAAMAIDVTLAQVHLVPPRWLIKSSSGKPSRKANRERIMSGDVPIRAGGAS